jgi:hypothetical protein
VRLLQRVLRTAGVCGALLGALTLAHAEGEEAPAAAASSPKHYPITAQQRATAKQVAQAGVPLSELADNAPDSYTVKSGDTLWGISGMYLKRPWRWPELWGMNLDQIHNPHLIYPGQILFLDKSNGRARLRVGEPVAESSNGSGKLSPRVRSGPLFDAIGAVPLHLIEPFLNEAVILQSENELDAAPRIVGTQEGRVVLTRGDSAYVLGERNGVNDFRVFRSPKALTDPTTEEVLGYEAVYVGLAEYVRSGAEMPGGGPAGMTVADTYTLTSSRLEAGIGDRMAPVPAREYSRYAPHAPAGEMAGQIVSIYGDGLSAGQNQIVALNKGAHDGIERGHVLALVTDGKLRVDSTDSSRQTIKLPNERSGLLFVFRVFDRMSYALILKSQEPVKRGDRFAQP